MFTVTVCCFYTGVDVNLSLLPGAINVKPGSFRALAGTPAIQTCLFSAKSLDFKLTCCPHGQRRKSSQQCREEGVGTLSKVTEMLT